MFEQLTVAHTVTIKKLTDQERWSVVIVANDTGAEAYTSETNSFDEAMLSAYSAVISNI